VTEALQEYESDRSRINAAPPHGRRSVPTNKSSNGKDDRTDDRRVQLVLLLLEDSPQRQWELSEIATMVNLSPGRLAHLFKSEIGVSIQQYLIQIRLTKAKHQLESTFLSIKEIAASVGFRNVTRFTECFKTAVGTTPAKYRKLSGIGRANAKKDSALARSAHG
jgi:transcriptional regulator GlxA family with amidase domain